MRKISLPIIKKLEKTWQTPVEYQKPTMRNWGELKIYLPTKLTIWNMVMKLWIVLLRTWRGTLKYTANKAGNSMKPNALLMKYRRKSGEMRWDSSTHSTSSCIQRVTCFWNDSTWMKSCTSLCTSHTTSCNMCCNACNL